MFSLALVSLLSFSVLSVLLVLAVSSLASAEVVVAKNTRLFSLYSNSPKI